MVPYFTGGNHVVFTSRDSERCARYVVGLAFHVEGVFALPGGQLSVQSLCRLQMPIYGNSSAVCHKDAIRYTWFGVYFVIPLLKDQERVLVTMTSLKLNLQASKCVRDGVVKDSHVYSQAGPASPAVLSQVLSCFSTHSCLPDCGS